jgi:type VI secretion system protein ImpK
LDASYAVVAYLDEAILTSSDPGRTQWSSLQSEMYEKAIAGEGFFDRLNTLRNRRDSARLAEVLEVYCLCLLLGYEGRYASDRKSELRELTNELRERIESVRGTGSLSPYPLSVVEEAGGRQISSSEAALKRWRIYALASIALAVLIWLLFRLTLGVQAGGIAETIRDISVL